MSSLHSTVNKTNRTNWKYKVSCQDRLTVKPSTEGWLEIQKRIQQDDSNFVLFNALLDTHKNVVVKVGHSVLEKEFTIGQTLDSLGLPTFLSPHCLFSCLEDVNDLKKKDLPSPLCHVKGNMTYILVIPYVNGKQIDHFNWTPDTLPLLKNIFLHVIASLFIGSKVGFLHNDLHIGNILIRRTKMISVDYGELGVQPLMGYIPVILDYDRSRIDKPHLIYKTDIHKYILSTLAACGLTLRTDPFQQLVSNLSFDMTLPSLHVFNKMKSTIESMDFL